jgi:NDP-sugar pyrophosphorylase family protein
MESFKAEEFFDLSSFDHRALFTGTDAVWQALGKIEAYLGSLKLGRIECEISPLAVLVNPESISIGEGTVVEAGAYIKGPSVIGKNCQIRQGAYIRGDVIVGDTCVVGHTTELKGVVMMNHSNAAHFAYIGDSIIGNHVNLGAGVKCANLRLDGKPILIHYQGKTIETGRRKFGAIIGDYAQIGCNSVLNPGALLGKYVQAYPCVCFGGVIEENSIVKPVNSIIIQKK